VELQDHWKKEVKTLKSQDAIAKLQLETVFLGKNKEIYHGKGGSI
jgi:hypothetical protein